MATLAQGEIRKLARFRYAIRCLLRQSEEAVRAAGLTPHQYQLLLGVAGFTDRGDATISELSQFLQLRHHSVVGLIDRAQTAGLVRRRRNPGDRRQVFVSVTAAGTRRLAALAAVHHKELTAMRRSLALLDSDQTAPRRAAAALRPMRAIRRKPTRPETREGSD